MELEKQVCGLEVAKRLKELGAKQESEYWWVMQKKVGSVPTGPYLEHHYVFMCGWGEPTIYSYERVASAFTVAELGEIMKDKGMCVTAHTSLVKSEWWVRGGEWICRKTAVLPFGDRRKMG